MSSDGFPPPKTFSPNVFTSSSRVSRGRVSRTRISIVTLHYETIAWALHAQLHVGGCAPAVNQLMYHPRKLHLAIRVPRYRPVSTDGTRERRRYRRPPTKFRARIIYLTNCFFNQLHNSGTFARLLLRLDDFNVRVIFLKGA